MRFSVILRKSDHTNFTEIFGYTYINVYTKISMKVQYKSAFASLACSQLLHELRVECGKLCHDRLDFMS